MAREMLMYMWMWLGSVGEGVAREECVFIKSCQRFGLQWNCVCYIIGEEESSGCKVRQLTLPP